MDNDIDAILDDLLSRWHWWARTHGKTWGYPRQAAGTELYRTSRQYDDANGALDDAVDDRIMCALDFQIRQMIEPYRSAIYEDARNLCMGIAVWSSPRLPTDPKERGQVISSARRLLIGRLTSAGVV